MESEPLLSVVITVDFRAGEAAAAEELRLVLAALAEQRGHGRVEFLYVESAEFRGRETQDLNAILPELAIVWVEATSAAAIKNAAVNAARGELIAMLDGDCVPSPGWLHGCLEAARLYPDAAVISGRTLYPGRSLVNRAMALLNRSYIEGDERGATDHVSQNNALYRRRALEMAPFVDGGGSHASRLQSETLRRCRQRLAFSSLMTVTHGFEGWRTERSIRADLGYSVVQVRRADPTVPHAWMIRFGVLSAPLVFGARLLHSWRLCLRHHERYGVAPHELPAAMLLALVCCALELPGLVRALRGAPRRASSFR